MTVKPQNKLSQIHGPVAGMTHRARGPGFDTESSHILVFPFPLIQKGQLLVTGESMLTRYWLTSLPRKSVVRLTDHPDMTVDVYRGLKTTTQQQPTNS